MKVKCVNGSYLDTGKVRYTLVAVDDNGVKLQPLESNVHFEEGVALTIGKIYDVTKTYQEVQPE